MFISVKTCIHTYALIYVDTLTCVCMYVSVCKLCTKTYNNISYKRRRRNFQ